MNKNLEVDALPDTLAHKNIAVMFPADMRDLGIEQGQTVIVRGRRTTRATVRSSENAIQGRIYMDATTRLNSSSRMTDIVQVGLDDNPRTVSRAQLAPVGEGISKDLEQTIGRELSMRPISRGDHITIPSLDGGVIELQVEKIRPWGVRSGLIDASTNVEIVERPARRPLLETGDVSFADIGGMDDVIKQIQQVAVVSLLHPELFLKAGKSPIRGILLHGEPGTGKSLTARALAREAQATYHQISAPEIVGGCSGASEENLRNLFEQAKQDEPSVIFIDEIDAIASDRRFASESGRRLVTQLLTLMDGVKDRGQVIVIGATNMIDSIDPAVNRAGRFERVIECPVPNADERLEILEIHTRGMPLSDDVDLGALSELTVGYVGADLDHLCKEGVYNAAERIYGFDRLLEAEAVEADDLEINWYDLSEAQSQVRPSIKRRHNRNIADSGFDSIIGLDDIKQILTEKIVNPVQFPELYSAAGLKIGSGVLMYGPPGTGKTALVRAVASTAGAEFLDVKGPEIMSMWQGESERSVREIFDKAKKMSPCVLFFDEFDSIAPDRSTIGPGRGASSSVVNQLLSELDGIDSRDGVLVVAATNQIDLIDPAFLREGRLGTSVEVGLPTREDYWRIVETHISDAPLSENLDLQDSCQALPDGMSGADLAGVSRRAKEIAIRRHLGENPDGSAEGFEVGVGDIEIACSELSQARMGIEAWR